MPAVVEPRDRLLPRVAALREADRALHEPRLGRHHTIVELASEPGRTREDAKPLELRFRDRRCVLRRVRVEELDRGHAVVPVRDRQLVVIHDDVLCGTDDHDGAVLLALDRALRREPGTEKLAGEALAGLGLGQEQEVVLRPAYDDDGGHDARLRRQQERLARGADVELLDLVRHHPVQVRRGVRPDHGDVRPGTRRGL